MRSFDTATIERWYRGSRFELPVLVERIHAGLDRGGRDIASVSRTHENLALTSIAEGKHGEALGHLAAAASAWAYLLETHLAGARIDKDLLAHYSSHPFGLALAANDDSQLARLSECFARAFPDARRGSNEFHWAGAMTELLIAGEVELASEWLATPPPRISDGSLAYFRSLVERDEAPLQQHCRSLSSDWRKTIRAEGLGKFPDAVCDHIQIGIVKLAERLWGYRPSIDLESAAIPAEIFDAVAVPVDGML